MPIPGDPLGRPFFYEHDPFSFRAQDSSVRCRLDAHLVAFRLLSCLYSHSFPPTDSPCSTHRTHLYHPANAGNWYEKRAAAATLAEPRLLARPKHARQVLRVVDIITASMDKADGAEDESFKVLRQGMGYCWSVAVVALPEAGKPLMEKWLNSEDKEILWIMKENLKKKRLISMDAKWVRQSMKSLE